MLKKICEEAASALVKAQKKETAQKVLDGTGVEEIVAERDAAKINLDAKTAAENTAKQDSRAKEADDKKSYCTKKMQKSVNKRKAKKRRKTCHAEGKAKTSTRESKESSRKPGISTKVILMARCNFCPNNYRNLDSKANDLKSLVRFVQKKSSTAKQNDAKKLQKFKL